ncbi:HSP20 domain-containing protein [Cephalotus follicularis]|uniref:HSP20 domain-containing protein n=1 Tax=Cephalotus follicularis TaxID=3775 RepID=A0A1Q3CGB7_CEPFO|nr:HSP20 domain-containing protein [Cephalotus follicularis]
MASYLALKRLASANILPKTLSLLRPVVTAPSASRFFNTNAVRQFDDEDGRNQDLDRRSPSRSRDDLFSDVFDPFSPTRSLGQVLNLMDQLTDNPFLSASRGVGAGIRRGWDAKETDNALNLRIDMPGLDKEDVKVCVEQNTLVIKGEGGKESEEEEGGRRYTSRIDLPEKIYKMDQIRAEMKNGVLKVVVPKLKEEDRVDVLSVKVE